MADRQMKTELERQRFRRELESNELDDETIDVLIDMGFLKVSQLQYLPKSYVDKMDSLNLAQKFILIGKIEEKWKSRDRNSSSDIGSVDASLSCEDQTSAPHRKTDTCRCRTYAEQSNEEMNDQSHLPKRSTEKDKTKETQRDPGTAKNRQPNKDNSETVQGSRDSGKRVPHQSGAQRKPSQDTKTNPDTSENQSTRMKNPGRNVDSSREKPSSRDNDHTTFTSQNSETDHQEPEIEEIHRSPSPTSQISSSDDEHVNCNLAKKYYTEEDYDAMEKMLADVDRAAKSPRGRIRFGVMLLGGEHDFADVYDCVNLQTNDVITMHDLIRQQFSTLADSHKTILRQMGLQFEHSTFSEWTVHTSAVFRLDSDLEYGSNHWERLIVKTEQLARFFSKLETPAKNVSKSFILLILHVVNRAWLIRYRVHPSDHHGLLRIATFCLPLCESDLVVSTYFCELKHDAYANATMMLGHNISNAILEVELFHDHFDEMRSRLKAFYNQCLEFAINPRNEDIDDNLEKIIDAVESKWAVYLSEIGQEHGCSDASRQDKDEHDRLAEDYVERIIKLCNNRSFAEVTREIAEAEEALQETAFKIKIGCLISSRFKHAFDSLSLPADTFGNERALFDNLRDKLVGLVIDCKEMLQEMKIYSNDAMGKWVDLFFEFYSLKDCMYGSLQWQEVLATGQTAVDDIPRGINPNGRTNIQMYVQLIIILIKKTLITYRSLVSSDHASHLRLSSMYLTMVKSSLLNSKWYLQLRHDAHQRNVINMGVCIINGAVTVDGGIYDQFRNMKFTLDKITMDCQKLRISTGLAEDRDEVNRIYEVIEKKIISAQQKQKENNPKMGGCQVNVIGGNEDVARIVSSAIDSFRRMNFDEMAVSLDEAEIFDSCDIRLAFAGAISPGFDQVVNFSNNIPESRGMDVVYTTTYVNLENLASDHEKVVTYMGEEKSSTLRDLIDYLFQQKGILPCTEKWDIMLEKAQAVVTYFQSLSKNAQCVTKCYILLLLTVLHNFMATRNRLRLGEHFEILPFVFACIPLCESELIESDTWVKTRCDVYEIAVLKTSSSLGAGQISCALWFPGHLKMLDELQKKANELDMLVCTHKAQLIQAREVGTNLYRGSVARMCISAALFYYDARIYKGMIAILEATDQTEHAVDIRMNFATQLSTEFELCVEQHNRVSEAASPSNLVTSAKFVLELASKDHFNILKMMRQSNDDDHLLAWVETLLDIFNGKNTFDSIAWIETEKRSLLAAEYILNLSESGRCISQAYLSFFMSFCMNFISTRHRFIKDDFMGELQMILSVIKLCKEAFVTSNFSVRLKSKACSLASLLFTRVTDFGESTLKELKELVKEVREYKQLTKQYEEELLKRAEIHKDWSVEANYSDDRGKHKMDPEVKQPSSSGDYVIDENNQSRQNNPPESNLQSQERFPEDVSSKENADEESKTQHERQYKEENAQHDGEKVEEIKKSENGRQLGTSDPVSPESSKEPQSPQRREEVAAGCDESNHPPCKNVGMTDEQKEERPKVSNRSLEDEIKESVSALKAELPHMFVAGDHTTIQTGSTISYSVTINVRPK